MPEDYSLDHKRDLDDWFSVKTKQDRKSSPDTKTVNSSIMQQALSYKFQLRDLKKYSWKLKKKDLINKF